MPLVGVIDLVLDYEAGPLIVDFKTAARTSEPMQITHEIQLSCYAYLLRHAQQVVGIRPGNPVTDQNQSAESGIPSVRGSQRCPFPPAIRRHPRIPRRPRLRQVQLPAGLRLCYVRLPPRVPSLGWSVMSDD